MRVLLSHESLVGFGGTETYAITVARALERLGHDVTIYSPNRGPMAEFARGHGVRVVGRDELPRSCELLLASDAATCHELASRCGDPVRVFVAHSADYLLQAPPQLRERCQAVVVLNDRVRRAVAARAWHPPIVRLRQPIDLQRFRPLAVPSTSRPTALMVSNYVTGARARLLEAACEAAGWKLTAVGTTTRPTPVPELAIGGTHAVIALGRSLLEGMAAGRAAYVYGVVGGDGWVTPDRYPAMEADGFAGTAMADVTLDVERLTNDLATWDERMGEVNRDLASAYHSAREHAIELVDLARGLETQPRPEPLLSDELAHLVRAQWQTELWANGAMAGVEELKALLAEADARAVDLEALARRANEQLEELRSTRRYRLACRIASPLDQFRGRNGRP